MARPFQPLLLLNDMVLVSNIGILVENCVDGTDSVDRGDEEGIGGVDEGGRRQYGGAQFPLHPGQRQELAVTKQSRPLRQTDADAFSCFEHILLAFNSFVRNVSRLRCIIHP